MSITIYDISKKANVSIATVSRVLNGSDNVRESTRKKVMDIIEKYDYEPNASARAMSLRSMKTIGLLCADSSDIFLAKAVYFLQRELQANGYESLLCCTGYNPGIRQNYMNLILSQKVDGIILVGSNFIGSTEDENKYIMDGSKKVPIMILNAAFDYPNVYCTLCDDSAAMYDAATRMIEHGIRDIVYLYNSKSYSGKKKLHGFETAMKDNGIENYEDFIRFIDKDPSQIEAAADFIEEYEKEGHTFHGIITADDALAVAATKYAQRVGRSIPEDLAVIGYNNSLLTECSTPELTSIENYLEAQSIQLVKTLLGVLSGEQMPQKTLFSGTIVARGTTDFI